MGRSSMRKMQHHRTAFLAFVALIVAAAASTTQLTGSERNEVTTTPTTTSTGTTGTTTTTATSKTASYECYEVTWKLKGANVTEDLPNYADAIVSDAEPKDLDEFIRKHIGNNTGGG